MMAKKHHIRFFFHKPVALLISRMIDQTSTDANSVQLWMLKIKKYLKGK